MSRHRNSGDHSAVDKENQKLRLQQQRSDLRARLSERLEMKSRLSQHSDDHQKLSEEVKALEKEIQNLSDQVKAREREMNKVTGEIDQIFAAESNAEFFDQLGESKYLSKGGDLSELGELEMSKTASFLEQNNVEFNWREKGRIAVGRFGEKHAGTIAHAMNAGEVAKGLGGIETGGHGELTVHTKGATAFRLDTRAVLAVSSKQPPRMQRMSFFSTNRSPSPSRGCGVSPYQS